MKEYTGMEVIKSELTEDEQFYMVAIPGASETEGLKIVDVIPESVMQDIINNNYDNLDANLKADEGIKTSIHDEITVAKHLYIPIPGALAVEYKANLKTAE